MATSLSKSQGKKVKLVDTYRFFKQARPELYGGSLIKNMLVEAPCLAILLASSTFSIMAVTYFYHKEKTNKCWQDKPFKNIYEVYRPDDPRIERMKMRPAYYNAEGTVPNPRYPVKELFQRN